ncbi:hypothetical protein CTAYLR_010440 [Chrysophaeum taylorii]|uniref:Aspartyl/asparaginy/proline hydroxylase domain-containing protein n=1 Tax=Chrysophaeum taylorii TaxID=2483200 RepID=A0AAD7XFM0_9STRA|nr:hypothetical protein CTAYLR_010440 [Chrysophaeum taylorii]
MKIFVSLDDDDGKKPFVLAMTLAETTWASRPVWRLGRAFSKKLVPPEPVSLFLEGAELLGSAPVGVALRDGAQVVAKRSEALAELEAASLLRALSNNPAEAGRRAADRATAALRVGDFNEALAVADAAIARCCCCLVENSSPEETKEGGRELGLALCFARAAALDGLGKPAATAYRVARRLCDARSDQWGTISHNLVLVLARHDDRAVALDVAKEVASRRPESADAAYDVATLATSLGRYDEARTAFRAALRADPTHAPSYVGLIAATEDNTAEAVAAAAIRNDVAWSDPRQRPQFWFPGLRATPWWDPALFWFVPYLERNVGTIRAEWLAANRPGREVGDRAGFAHDGTLKLRGSWTEHVFFPPSSTPLFPETKKILDRITEATGAAQIGCGETLFSTLAPGTRLRPHCGSTNARLTLHLGVVVPAGDLTTITCGGETRRWVQDKAIVFDDSFEHEVSHNADTPRTVLLMNFWHPQIPPNLRRDPNWRSQAKHGALLQTYIY